MGVGVGEKGEIGGERVGGGRGRLTSGTELFVDLVYLSCLEGYKETCCKHFAFFVQYASTMYCIL